MIGYRGVGGALAIGLMLLSHPAASQPPDVLRRGINITNWFRFPPSRDPAALRAYLNDGALRELKRAGFTFIRLPVQADLAVANDALADAIERIQRHGLGVVIALFGSDWRLESEAGDRARLLSSWRSLALALRRFDPKTTMPEVLNEPVFAGKADAWARLQHEALTNIRAVLPGNPIVLTGPDWGSVSGLVSLQPETDRNVIYSFHLYEPAELTALGAYRHGLDETAMARLPFPVADPAACAQVSATTRDAATAGLMRFYCGQRWDVAKVTARIAEAGAWARRHQVTVLAGEFGASGRLNEPARFAWIGAVRAACEHEGAGWALWGYDDVMGFGMRLPHRAHGLDPRMLRALGLTPSK